MCRAGVSTAKVGCLGTAEVDPLIGSLQEADIRQAMRDLRAAGVDCLTLGQYLQPDRHTGGSRRETKRERHTEIERE